MKISSSKKLRRLVRVLIVIVVFIAALQVVFYIFGYYENKQIEKEIATEVELSLIHI